MPVPSILPLARWANCSSFHLFLFFPHLHSPVHGRTVRSHLPWVKTSPLRIHADIWVGWILMWLL